MSELVEPMARAIAAHKRRLPPDHPEIDRVWSSYCGQVRAALSVIESRDGWQPIATAPAAAYGEGVDLWVVVDGVGERMTDCYRQANGRWYNLQLNYGDGDYVEDEWSKVTHWMPLPSPPIRNGEG